MGSGLKNRKSGFLFFRPKIRILVFFYKDDPMSNEIKTYPFIPPPIISGNFWMIFKSESRGTFKKGQKYLVEISQYLISRFGFRLSVALNRKSGFRYHNFSKVKYEKYPEIGEKNKGENLVKFALNNPFPGLSFVPVKNRTHHYLR